jgi:hypothetical protein
MCWRRDHYRRGARRFGVKVLDRDANSAHPIEIGSFRSKLFRQKASHVLGCRYLFADPYTNPSRRPPTGPPPLACITCTGVPIILPHPSVANSAISYALQRPSHYIPIIPIQHPCIRNLFPSPSHLAAYVSAFSHNTRSQTVPYQVPSTLRSHSLVHILRAIPQYHAPILLGNYLFDTFPPPSIPPCR